MSDSVQIAVISGLFTSIPLLLINYLSNRKVTALNEYRLNEIEKKLDNALKDLNKINILEKSVLILDEKIKNIRYDVEDIKKWKKN